MSFLCAFCPRRKDSDEQDDVGLEPSVADESYQVQIETSSGKRWQSSELKLHDEVPVVPIDPSDQKWYLETEEHSALWSFYIKTPENKKLYVTYDASDTNDKRVTLEYSSSETSKKRHFLILRQEDIGFIVASPSNPKNILGFNGKVLIMTSGGEYPAEELKWIISPDGNEIIGQSTTSYGEIALAAQIGMKWISDEASRQDYIRVAQSSRQEWKISGDPTCYTFEVPSGELFASRTEESEEEVLFEGKLTKSNLREYTLLHDFAMPPGSFLIQSLSNNWYAGTNDSNYLNLKQEKQYAGGWYILTTRFVFPRMDDTIDVFPPFSDTDKPHCC